MLYLTIIPFLLYFTNTAFALQCYECDSSKNVACNYGLLSFTQSVKDCSSEGGLLGSIMPASCNKIVAVDKNGNEYIAKGCILNTGPINTCQGIAKLMQFAAADQDLQSIDCFTCSTDKCNSASTISGFTVVGILSACLIYLLF